MASSLGDVVTLGILAGCANYLLVNIGNYIMLHHLKSSSS